jgi:hypothetical protein
VPNHGYLVVMWDPGLASKYDVDYWDDYCRVFGLIAGMNTDPFYKKLKLKAPSAYIRENLIDLLHIFYNTDKSEDVVMSLALKHIKLFLSKIITFGGKPPDFLLNIKPYTMF